MSAIFASAVLSCVHYLENLLQCSRQYKQKTAEESKRKKRLKVDSWEIVDENAQEDNSIDIRDVEFRMTNDASRIRALISGASSSSGRDLVTLKLVLCRALYPQIAVADEFNHCKVSRFIILCDASFIVSSP